MSKISICCPEESAAIREACTYLRRLGAVITEELCSDTQHILLPVPCPPSAAPKLEALLCNTGKDFVISGGNLAALPLSQYRTVDFLTDPYYLADNAAITARCTMRMLQERTVKPLSEQKVLVLGWGRIGKCLAKELQQFGAAVTVAARRDTSLAMAHALGYSVERLETVSEITRVFDVIVNTIPVMVLPHMQLKEGAVAIELASSPGMSGDGIISARGLPGKLAPKESGKLIAETFIRLSLKKEVSL